MKRVLILLLACLAGVRLVSAEALPPMGHYAFEGLEKRVYYFAQHPLAQGDAARVAVIIVHGWGDGVNLPLEVNAFRTGVVSRLGSAAMSYVVAPAFPRLQIMAKQLGSDDGRAHWNDSWSKNLSIRGTGDDDWRGGGDANGTKLSSFDVIDAIFAALADRAKYPNLVRVVLAGYSAGGQFAGRYAAVGKGRVREGVTLEYAAMAPSTQFLPDDEVGWHYGLKGRPRYSAGLTRAAIFENLATRRIWYGCGSADVRSGKFTALDSTPEAMLQGSNRYFRFLNLRERITQYPRWAAQATFHEFPGLAHNCRKAYPSAAFVSFALDVDLPQPPVRGENATAFWQAKVDAVAVQGGGRVCVPAGDWAVAGLRLKSNVELNLAAGARLYGITNLKAYVAMNSVVHAIGATNVAVTGEGTIDGIGAEFNRLISRKPFKLCGGWRTLTFRDCRDVRVEGVTLRGATSWTCYLAHNDGVVLRNVTVRSHANYTNDGVDVDSRNVLIENCDIDAEDDALVFKTHAPDYAVENVVVRNCRLASNSSTLKFGTESYGIFRNVQIGDCLLFCGAPSRTIAPHNAPGETPETHFHAISGIEISSVDGALIDGMTISNVTMGVGINTPVFVRLARRHPSRNAVGGAALRNVLLQNIRMEKPATSAIACSITGLPDLRPQNVVLRDCSFQFGGGGTAAHAVETYTNEREAAFPMPSNLFKSALPAYGFYLRHADGIVFENVELKLAGSDARPPVVADDAQISLKGCAFDVIHR